MSLKPKRKYILTLFCLLVVFLYSPDFSDFLTTTPTENSNFLRYEVDNVSTVTLIHTIRIKNPTNSKVAGGKLFVPLIRNETACQYAIVHNISSMLGQPTILSDNSENTYAYWNNIIIDGKQTVTIEMNYHVLSFSTRYMINSSLIVNYDKSSDLYKRYTQPEELIQSDNSKIISKALDITNDESNLHEKASEIYNFVVTYMHYVVQNEEKGALWALENGVGDCSEYSYLFVALCRAAGIPARIQTGFAFHSLQETLNDGHMWAEYYLENYGWIPVDATWRLFDAMDYRHFSAIQSIPEVIPYANYVFNNTIGPEPSDEQTVTLKQGSPNTFDQGSFAENIMKIVQKIKQTEFTFFLGRIFAVHLIFPSQAEKSTQTLLESKIHLQNAIDFWETYLQFAQLNAANALENAQKASQDTWILITEAFAFFISVSIVIMLITLVFLKRYKTKLEKKH